MKGPLTRLYSFRLPDSIGDDFARTGLGLVGWCFYRVLNQDESNETIAPPGPRYVTGLSAR